MSNPNSSALRAFTAEPYNSEADVLASKQITAALAGSRVFTKDRRCFDVLPDNAVAWDAVTAGGAKLSYVNTGVFDMDLMQDGTTKVAMTVAEREAVAGAVRHDEAQSLTAGQRQQAAENIAAVSYDAQALTDAQRVQVRNNIRAALNPDTAQGGSWSRVYAAATAAVVLPSGGRWAFFYIRRNSSTGGVNIVDAGVAAGGTNLFTTSPNEDANVLVWRVA